MYSVTMLTAPNSFDLTVDVVRNFMRKWGGYNLNWLAPGEAAAFGIDDVPQTQALDWADLQACGVDLVVQPVKGQKKDVLLADMDSTLIHQECIDELAEEAGLSDQIKTITEMAMNGDLDFEEALTARVRCLKGQSTAIVDSVWRNRIKISSGAGTLIQTMRKNGGYVVVVSGGFTVFTERLASALDVDEHHANQLLVDNDLLTGEVAQPILGRTAKLCVLQDVAGRLGVSTNQVMAVGDGANDLDMLRKAGSGVAMHAKPIVASQCDHKINFGDLTALLYLQGYKKSDFCIQEGTR